MRNKWYVVGLSVAAAVCLFGVIQALRGDMQVVALLPGALAVGLIIAAVKTARADSFGPVEKKRWDVVRPPAVLSWLKNRESAPTRTPPGPAKPAAGAPESAIVAGSCDRWTCAPASATVPSVGR